MIKNGIFFLNVLKTHKPKFSREKAFFQNFIKNQKLILNFFFLKKKN